VNAEGIGDLVPAGSHRVGNLLPPHGKPEQEPA